ncbi:MAG: protease complex subunit PrcB family protein [Dethiobacter sp.]|jgi:hypothetical protein|nr:MAG: protease complex subunit PrcB family protein [Dethiobacter sp.]
MRRIIAVMVILLIVFSVPVPLAANEKEIKIFVDGEEVGFRVPPVFLNGCLLVPMRPLLEALEAEINWDGATGTVTARRGDDTIVLQIKETFALVNGKRVELDVPATIIQGSTMVPLRFFSEFLGLYVRWNAEPRIAEVDSSILIPFERPGKDTEKWQPWIREWVESSWDELNIQVKTEKGKMYILTTFGLRPTGGYEVEIKRIERTREAVKLVIDFTEPSREQYTIPVFNRPYDLVCLDPVEMGACTYFICLHRGLKEGTLPVRLELNP